MSEPVEVTAARWAFDGPVSDALVEDVAAALTERLPAFLRELGPLEVGEPPEREGGVLAVDARAGRALAECVGAEKAAVFLARCRGQPCEDRAAKWRAEGRLFAAKLLAWALSSVRSPAVTMPVLDTIARVHLAPNRRLARRPDGSVAIVDALGRMQACVSPECAMPVDVPASLLDGGFQATATLTGHRLFRWLVHEVARHQRRGALSPGSVPVLTVPGGMQGLAEAIGEPSSRGRDRLRDILDAFQFAQLEVERGTAHGLLTWTEREPGRNGRGGEVQITPSSVLAPRGGRGSGKRVPVPLRLPPFLGDESGSPRLRHLQPAQATMQVRLLALFREAGGELVAGSGVRLSESDFRQAADASGLPRDRVAEVVARFQEGPEALLVRVEHERWDLGEVYAAERAAIVEGGRIDAASREQGKRSAAFRRAKARRSPGRAGGTGR